MQLSNYHSHCTFCDGRSIPEDFVRFAITHGFRAYGFSSHSPLPFETFWNMSKDDMPEYLQEINRLKQKYSDQLEIYAGLEIDYLDETYNASIPYFQELPLDYRIGSIHFLPVSERLVEENMVCIDGSFREYAHSVERHFEGDVRLLVKRFFDTTMKMIEAGGIDIVGHMDKIYMNGQKYEIFNFEESGKCSFENRHLTTAENDIFADPKGRTDGSAPCRPARCLRYPAGCRPALPDRPLFSGRWFCR